jgi:hypothetical protein
MSKNLAKVEDLQEVVTTTTNVELSKAEIATEIRKQAEELIGHRARIVPAGTIDWVEGWVKTTQADLRPKTPCVLVVVEGDDGKIYRRTYGSKLLEVDLTSEKRETKSKVHVPETLEELEEALKKARVQLESATNKVNLLTRALEEAKKNTKE